MTCYNWLTKLPHIPLSHAVAKSVLTVWKCVLVACVNTDYTGNRCCAWTRWIVVALIIISCVFQLLKSHMSHLKHSLWYLARYWCRKLSDVQPWMKKTTRMSWSTGMPHTEKKKGLQYGQSQVWNHISTFYEYPKEWIWFGVFFSLLCIYPLSSVCLDWCEHHSHSGAQ